MKVPVIPRADSLNRQTVILLEVVSKLNIIRKEE
jgi:hypothetical protein